MENKTKARCQVGNKALKRKLTNMLRGKERKKEQICKVKQRQIKKIYIHERLTARGKKQQEKQRNKCRKNNSFKKLKLKKEKRKKRKTPQNCKSPMQRQRFIIAIKKCY